MDLNGIVLLSQILSFDNSIDGPKWNPGVDQAYALALPTFAATAFYHHEAADSAGGAGAVSGRGGAVCDGGVYELRCCRAANCRRRQKQAVAEKLHGYTGLPVEYLLRANLRVSGAAFSKHLQLADETTTGRLDARYKGPDLDPLSADAEYDPQSNAISSAYTAALNQYMRTDLKYGADQTYKPGAYSGR